MKKILVIQTAFIGDVILATATLEKLRLHFPEAEIDFLLRKGNESLFARHPFLHETLIWDKKNGKYGNLWKMMWSIQKRRYDLVVNLQRFLSTGLLTVFSGAAITTGFDKNPLSFLFIHKRPHIIGTKEKPIHEVERNLSLIEKWTDDKFIRPKLYPSPENFEKIPHPEGKFITVSPASVWFTKQWPKERWIDFIDRVGEETVVFLLGGSADLALCEEIRAASKHARIENMAGRLSLLESAALMQSAGMNFVNDSAPLHLASAVNAPVTAIFCSTVPEFGFTPLSDISHVVQTDLDLDCRPCSFHGRKSCPMGHFKCAHIDAAKLLSKLP